MDLRENKQTRARGLKSYKTKPASERIVTLRFRRTYGKWPTGNELRQFKLSNPISY